MRQLADLDFGNVSRIQNLPNAVAAQQPVTKAQLDAAIEGISWKVAVRVSTQGNLNLASPGAAIDGINLAVSDRVLVRAQTSGNENGIYIWNGAAVPMTRALDASSFEELEGAAVTVQEGTDGGVTYRQTEVNGTIGVDDVSWTTFGTAAPNASETVAGLVELATQAEADAGTDDQRAMTPAKMRNVSWLPKKYATTFGDTSNTSFTITHNLGTRDVQVYVYEAASPYGAVAVDIRHTDANNVEIVLAAAPGNNALRAVVVG